LIAHIISALRRSRRPRPSADQGKRGELSPYPVTAAARWLLDPGGHLSAEIRAAFVRDIQVSRSSLIGAVITVMFVTVFCAAHTGSLVLWLLAGWGVIVCGARVTLSYIAFAPGRTNPPVVTDLYVAVMMLWCLTHGVMACLYMASNITIVQLMGVCAATAPHTPLCARHYLAPRLCKLMVVAIILPWMLGSALAHERGLLLVLGYGPLYISAIFATIQQFLDGALELQRARLDARAQARRDPLTGALNRLGAAEAMQRGAADNVFALLCLDLDGFKAVNDQHGHPAGDELLRQVTRRLQKLVRGVDEVARLGGDEFLVIAPGMRPADCEAFASRLIAGISEPYALDGAVRARVGVSVGFACAPEDGMQLDALHARADAALYEAKQQGKGTWRRGFGRAA
jgi:diguanylate cyclase (GGDEF)-like protein